MRWRIEFQNENQNFIMSEKRTEQTQKNSNLSIKIMANKIKGKMTDDKLIILRERFLK